MALNNILSKCIITGITGGSVIGVVKSYDYFVDIPSPVTKTSISKTIKLIKPLEFYDVIINNNIYLYLLAGSTSCLFLYKIGFGNIMYASRTQLRNGVLSLTKKITTVQTTLSSLKTTITDKLYGIDKKIDNNHENIKLIIKQKHDELKCDIKEMKNTQSKNTCVLGLLGDKINIIESQGKYISRGVYLLCDSVLNKGQDLQQLRQYKKLEEDTVI